jgi:dihydrofolate synthase / folylpolyglutamate synthase
MDYLEAVAYLDAHIGLGGRPGLERMNELMDFMGHPEQGYPIIHVAGTNGKTSTARLATMILVAHGLTTGTHTSPHLQRVEERLAVNGRVATPDEFALAVTDVASFADLREVRGGTPNTYFEITAAASFAFFADQAVNAAVVEVGLGGRLDATNVVEAEVCVITSIGLDHTAMLGNDLASIAAEKVAIAGPESTLVSGPLDPAALDVVVARARELGVHHRRFGPDFGVDGAERGVGGWLATIRGAEAVYEDIFLPVHGRHQLTNLAMAVASSEALLGDRLASEAVRDAAAAVTLPGRMERLSTGPLVLVDGAHNPQGVEVLAASLAEEFPTVKWQLVIAAMSDKDVEEMVAHLSPHLVGVVTTAVASERAIPAEALADRIGRVVDVPVLAADTVAGAFEMARAEAGTEGAVLVAGSLYLVGAVRDIVNGHDFA